MGHPATKEKAKESFAALLREAGLRVTSARLEVMGLLQQSSKPLTHGDVVQALQGSPWDRATIYRNLMDLSVAGLLRRVSLGSAWHFECCFDENGHRARGNHPHFVCTECGVVECATEVEMTIEANRKSAKAIRRGQVEVQLHGICDDCA